MQEDYEFSYSILADGAASPTERLRIASSGQIGLGGANYGTSGQVLTSNGSSAAVTWEDASGGGGITTQVGNASGIVTSMFLTDAIDHKITATGICTITTTQAGTRRTITYHSYCELWCCKCWILYLLPISIRVNTIITDSRWCSQSNFIHSS